MKPISTLLIDMDAILVDMLPTWLARYNAKTGERIVQEELKSWEITDSVSEPDILFDLLLEDDFFLKLPPVVGAMEYFPKLYNQLNLEVIVLTMAPRNSLSVERGKKMWLKTYFPTFPVDENLAFFRKKYLVYGDLLFDDRSSHLLEWKRRHPDGITATISYPYNLNYGADWRFDYQHSAWKAFYEAVQKHNEKYL